MKNDDLHIKTTFVLKNGNNSLEFTSRRAMNAYYKRFIKLFPDVPLENISMFKVVVFKLKSSQNESN